MNLVGNRNRRFEAALKILVLRFDGEVLFQPPAQTETGSYLGVLTVQDVVVEASDLAEIVLRYDPAGGDAFVLVPACEGSAADPQLPGEATSGWCFYGISAELDNGNFDITWLVFGIDDPKFAFR